MMRASLQSLRLLFCCRGKFRSKPWTAILEEAKILVAQGAKELNLIAEDTNQWGMDRRDGLGLAQLLRELAKLEGLRWMRLLYCYPSYFTEELIDEIASNPKVTTFLAFLKFFQSHSQQRPASVYQHMKSLILAAWQPLCYKLSSHYPTACNSHKCRCKLNARPMP